MLCDYAEEVNGKLYIMGGGWTTIQADTPAPLALAVLLTVPWNAANQKHTLNLSMLTEDGEPFLPDGVQTTRPEGAPEGALMGGDFEVGRPPGAVHGQDFPVPIGVRLGPLVFPQGGYKFEFTVDGTVIASRSFRAIAPRS